MLSPIATRVLRIYDSISTSFRIAPLLKDIKGGFLDLQVVIAIVFVLQRISPWMLWLLRSTNGVVLAMVLVSLVLLPVIHRGIRKARYVHARRAEHQRSTNIDEQYRRPWRAILDNQDRPYLVPPTFYFDNGYPSVPPTYAREARYVHARRAEHQRLTNIDFLDYQGRPYLVPSSSLYFPDVYDQSVPPTYVREARYVHARRAEHQRLTNIDFLDYQGRPYLVPSSSLYFPDVYDQSVPPTYVREARYVHARRAEHQRLTNIDFLDYQGRPYLVPSSSLYFPDVYDQSVPPTYVREARYVHARRAEHQRLTNIDFLDYQGRPYLVPSSSLYFPDVYDQSVPPTYVRGGRYMHMRRVEQHLANIDWRYGGLQSDFFGNQDPLYSVPPTYVRAITSMLVEVPEDIKEGMVILRMICSTILEFKIMGACLLCFLWFAANGGDGVQLTAVHNRPVIKWMLRSVAGRVVAVVWVLACWSKNKKRARTSSRPFELSPRAYAFCTGSASSFGNVDSAGGSTYSFILDSGASYHATGCRAILDNFQDLALDEIGNTIGAANGQGMSIQGRGSISLPGFTLPSVLYVPELRVNVVSVCQLTLMDYYVKFDRIGCLVREVCTEAVVGRGRMTCYDGLYQMETLAVPLDRGRCEFCAVVGNQLFLT